MTASIQNDIMTVSAVGSGTIVSGAVISGTGVFTGTQIASQLSGTVGGVGTYLLSIDQRKSIASETISGTYGVFTVGTMTVGTGFQTGQIVSGSTTLAGTVITQLLTGTGGNGSTFAVNLTQTVASFTASATLATSRPSGMLHHRERQARLSRSRAGSGRRVNK